MDFAYRIPKEARGRAIVANQEEMNFASDENMLPHLLRELHEKWLKEEAAGCQDPTEANFFQHLPQFIRHLELKTPPEDMLQDPAVHHVLMGLDDSPLQKKAAVKLGYGFLFNLGEDAAGAAATDVAGAAATDAASVAERDAAAAAAKKAEQDAIDKAAQEPNPEEPNPEEPGKGKNNPNIPPTTPGIFSKAKKLVEGAIGIAGIAGIAGRAIQGILGSGSGGAGGGTGLSYNPEGVGGPISSEGTPDAQSVVSKTHYSHSIPDNLIEEERNTMEHRASVEDDAGILVYAAKDLRMEQLREQVRASLEAWANSSNDPQNPESLPQSAFAVWWALYNAATKADDIATLSGILAAVPEMYHTQGVPQVEVPNASGGSDTQTGLAAAPNPMEMNEAKEAQPLAFNPGGSQPEQPGKSPGNLIPGALSSVQRVSAWKIADMSGMQANMPAPGIPAGAAPPPVPSVPPTTAETTGAMGDQTNQQITHQMNFLPANPVNSTQVQAPDPNVQQMATGPTGQVFKETSPAGSNVAGFARSMTSNAKESNWQIVADIAPPTMPPGMMPPGMMTPQQVLPQQPTQSTEEQQTTQSTNSGFAGSELTQNPKQTQQMVNKQQQQPFSTAPNHPILTTDGQMEANNPSGARISADTSVIPNKEQPNDMPENLDEEKTTDPHEVAKIQDKEGKVIEVGAVYELSNEDYSPELVRVASIQENGVVVQTLDTGMQFFVTENEQPQFIQKKASMLSSREQDSLINETGTARNLSDVRLSDSHYEDEYPKFHEKLIEAFDHSRPLSNASLFDDDSLFL